MISEEDQNNSWNYSYAPGVTEQWRSDDSNVPGMWLGAEKQKHWKKMKRRRAKMPHFRFQEEVSWTFDVICII